MDLEACVPPGFRFHPTEEELVGYYLKRKINSLKFDLDVINDIDLYKMEPWDIQEKCKLGYEEQNEWYFFSHKDRKYPTGTRTNRATAAGFWKATGRDKAVLSCKNKLIGMRKTLVFYKGRAPNGRKSDWIMHEYRFQTSEHAPPQEEGWVVCRAFKKPIPNQRPIAFEAWNHHPNNYPNHINPFRPPPNLSHSNPNHITDNTFQQPLLASESDININSLIDLPKLDSPTTLSTGFATSHDNAYNSTPAADINEDYDEEITNNKTQFIDWKNMDGLVGSHLNEDSFSNIPNLPSIPQSYDLDTYNNHFTQFLGCFPNL